MSQDVAADSSSAPIEEIREFGDLLYSDPTPEAESAPAAKAEQSDAVDETTDETESESDPETETEESENEPEPEVKPKPESPAQKRIKQLLAENKRLKEQSAPKTEAPKTEAPKTETKVEEVKEPVPGDFETWDAYQTAHRDYLTKTVDQKVKDAIEKDRAEQATKAEADKQQAEMQKLNKQMQDRQKQTETRIPDLKKTLFDESGALKPEIQLHPVFDNFIPKSEVGWDILHHIATHPEEAEKIAAMDIFGAAGEFHRLHSEITAKIQNSPKRQPPKPPRTVSGTTPASQPKSFEQHLYGDD